MPVQVSGGRYPRNPERQRAFEVWSQLYTGQPVNAKDVLRAAQVSKDESTVRRWCRAWEKEADLEPAVDETAQPDFGRSTEAVMTDLISGHGETGEPCSPLAPLPGAVVSAASGSHCAVSEGDDPVPRDGWRLSSKVKAPRETLAGVELQVGQSRPGPHRRLHGEIEPVPPSSTKTTTTGTTQHRLPSARQFRASIEPDTRQSRH